MPFSSKLLQMGAAGAGEKLYVENVFSTYLYTGNGSTQTITNGIDLSGEGGLVWIKSRAINYNILFDTNRGPALDLYTDYSSGTYPETENANGLTAFNADGFSVGSYAGVNTSSENYASWTFRKAEKFFDVVTYTGNGSGDRAISHNLGSTPGFIVVKPLNATGGWACYHRSLGNNNYLYLNQSQSASSSVSQNWNPTSTTFQADSFLGLNNNTTTYVAYLFAHNAGGFGDAGDQNVVSCGSYVGTGGDFTVTLGWEPQFIIVKAADVSGDWQLIDTMRGWTASGVCQRLEPNTSDAEATSGSGFLFPTATGFGASAASGTVNAAGFTYIYIAIRRGPMKTPTSGTSVFSPQTQTGSSPITTNFVVDNQFWTTRNGTYNFATRDRLRGGTAYLTTSSTAAQATGLDVGFDSNTGVTNGYGISNAIAYYFQRAPGFFDVVCYTGTGSARTVSHNLGVAPELMIVKNRSTTTFWAVYAASLGNTYGMELNDTAAAATTYNYWNNTSPTSSVSTVNTDNRVNGSGDNYVAYLFATVAGVSKVGSYTGNGSNQTINCGFTAGARFVLIKRTDSTGDWVVFDSARGIVSGNDPYLELNTTDAEVTDKDAVDTDNTGFVVNETTGPNVNTNSATYIYLAIA